MLELRPRRFEEKACDLSRATVEVDTDGYLSTSQSIVGHHVGALRAQLTVRQQLQRTLRPARSGMALRAAYGAALSCLITAIRLLPPS